MTAAANGDLFVVLSAATGCHECGAPPGAWCAGGRADLVHADRTTPAGADTVRDLQVMTIRPCPLPVALWQTADADTLTFTGCLPGLLVSPMCSVRMPSASAHPVALALSRRCVLRSTALNGRRAAGHPLTRRPGLYATVGQIRYRTT